MTSEFEMHGKNVLVTGALGLIGREIVDALASAGANQFLSDAQPLSNIEDFASEVSGNYDLEFHSAQADISNPDSVTELVAKAVEKMGSIDTFVHCAGVDTRFDGTDKDTPPTAFHEFPLYAWERSVNINMTGTMLITQAVIKQMLTQQSGNVVLIASTYSLVAPNQNLYHNRETGDKQNKPIDYVATKSMVPNFVRYLGASYAKSGIRVNCVAPHGIANDHPEWFKKNFAELTPIARMCEPSELRGPFLLLASDASSYMTGSTLVVDGGWTAW
jgi:NAD(P)-dependent dehydrogenase (short-subunit alcohol dehydrogenase family)